ncbi:MAG TPA: aldose 1-epimerase family protein [Methylovirgula sp.]|nr:aldose 1-epimerase family protein [Methylovirgula sp.]
MIHLVSGATRAAIALHGAELKDWRVGETPLLWAPDPEVWNETAPLLFPVVGWTKDRRVRVGEKIYPLGLHGFARHFPFRALARGEDYARLVLTSDVATRALYPFDFRLTADYHLSAAAIFVALTVENCGPGPMPYACGLHPGFRWPFAGGRPKDYSLRFSSAEDPFVPVIARGGLISQARRPIPFEGAALRLDPQLFEKDALCLIGARSRSVRFEAPNGPAIVIESSFPHFALWCRPGRGFLCIEEWTGYSDPEDFAGDLFDKPSMLVLPPGASGRHWARFAYENPPH